MLRPPGRVSNPPRRRRCPCRPHPSPLRCSATPPFQPAPVRVLGGVQRIDSCCGKRASIVAFFSAPAAVRGPVVTIAAPVLLGIATVGAREAPAPMPCGRGWSRHRKAGGVVVIVADTDADAAAPVLLLLPLPLPSSQWMASANHQHRRRQSLPLSTTTTQVSDDDDDDGTSPECC